MTRSWPLKDKICHVCRAGLRYLRKTSVSTIDIRGYIRTREIPSKEQGY
jgi:hypothetical protein